MQFAFDRITQELITAERAHHFLGNRYVCPVCHASVHLREGQHNRKHFAHDPGKAQPDCLNYFPGSGYVSDSGGGRRLSYGERLRSVYLAVHVLTERGKPYHWQLELGVPRLEGYTSDLVLPFGLGGRQTLPASRLRLGVRVPVKLGLSKYQVEVAGPKGESVPSYSYPPVQGLDREAPNVFELRLDTVVGRRVEEDDVLWWGKTYAIIFSGNKALEYIPNSVRSARLRPNEGWGGTIVSLPSAQDWAVNAWADSQLGLRVQSEPMSLELLHPIPTRIADDGSLVVPPNSEVVIGVEGTDEKQRCELLVEASDGSWGISDIFPGVWSFGQIEFGRLDISVEGTWEHALRVVALANGNELSANGIQLTIGEDGSEIRLQLFSRGLAEKLEAVRDARATLKEVWLPNNLMGVRLIKSVPQRSVRSLTEVQELVGERSGFILSTDGLAIVQEVLQSGRAFEISAGAFGRVHIRSREVPVGSQRKELEFTVRGRWLASMGINLGGTEVVRAPKRLQAHIRAASRNWARRSVASR